MAVGICGCQGLGKLRHIDAQCLWIQQKVRSKSISLLKVRGEENPADLFTKHLVGRDRIHMLLALFGCEYRGGRAAAAPQVRAGTTTSKGELLKLHAHVTEPVKWDGKVFEKAFDVEGVVPEAFRTLPGLLPPLHDDLYDRFPRAITCEAGPDVDPPADDSLEVCGRIIGEQVVRPKR